MRGTLLIATLLVFGLIVAGCTGPSPQAGGQAQNGQAAQPSGNGGAGAQVQTPEQEQTQEQEQEQEQQGGSGSQEGSGADDLAGKTYEALAAMGVPLQCQMSAAAEGGTFTAKVYMKGSSEVRSEGTAPEGECPKTVTIIKGNKYYVACEGAQIMEGCDWMEFTFDDSEAADTGGGSFEAPDYSDVPPAQISCQPWIYDSSKFQTPGNVCNLDEIMNQYKGMYQGGYEE